MFRLTVCAAIALASGTAYAGTISYTGDLRTDGTVTACGTGCTLGAGNSDGDYAQWAAAVYSFNVPVTSTMTAVTFSYGGGMNGAGATIAQGGLEPYLSLFDSAGNFLASTYFGVTCPSGANVNTASGQCYDVELDAGTLAAGTYEIALTAYANMSLAENPGGYVLSDGFTGLGNLAAGEDLHYAFDVNLMPEVATPEPGSAGLLMAAMGVVIFKIRRGK